MPLVSIITINLNDRAGLGRTLESIGRQTFRDRETIVVDGGSTDGSVDVIRAQAAAGTVTEWVSEKDAGIFDAMNKGIRRAHGTYLVFMNGGDSFAADDALERFFAAGAPTEEILYSEAIVEHDDGSTHVYEVPVPLCWDYFMRTSLPHQSTAIRKDLFERVGLYETGYRICGDLEFFLRAVVSRGATSRFVPVRLAIQQHGGMSSREDTFTLHREERKRAREQALSPLLLAHWEEYLAAKRGFLHHAVRSALRPVTRKMRSFTRKLRRKPDSLV